MSCTGTELGEYSLYLVGGEDGEAGLRADLDWSQKTRFRGGIHEDVVVAEALRVVEIMIFAVFMTEFALLVGSFVFVV